MFPKFKILKKVLYTDRTVRYILSCAKRGAHIQGRLAQGDERFPDTEEVTSSNLVTPTRNSQAGRVKASGLLLLNQAVQANEFDSCEKVGRFQLKARIIGRFAKERGVGHLLDCLERNESAGVVYHRSGVVGDYDVFDNPDELMAFIESGARLRL